MQVIFLGCSDEHGVPRVGCECRVCRGVLSPGGRNYRTGPSVALRYGPSYAERTVLIDAAPEFRLQATALGLRHFDALLLTHSHDAHILGLGALLSSQREAGLLLQVYAPSQVLDEARSRFSYHWIDRAYRRVLQPHPLADPVDLWGVQVHPVRVDHGTGGTAFGYVLCIGQRRLAYIPDMLRASEEVRQALTGLDLLVLGASHYYDDTEIWKRSILDITSAQELIGEVRPEQAILTHLSHTVDYDEISPRLSSNIRLAYDGLIVEMRE
jgi:phosphoribosyl 1,2-cyclic phosphate phosphodiesterase